jgi:ribosomal protein L11 methylase PrmA
LKNYPALDVRCDSVDLLLAMVDDFSPTAVEERDRSVRVFFSNAADRDAARFTVASRFPAGAIDVSDEDWARRSQDNLAPVTVGRLTIVPSPDSRLPNPESRLANPNSRIPNPDSRIPNPEPRIPNPEPRIPNPDSRIPNPESRIPNPCAIVIVPSMGFGTGHHATTRLCLEALQSLDLTNAFVLDVGTGSGILAIAAVRLGAARALGIDNDADAIQAARDNLAHNHQHLAPGSKHQAPTRVAFELADLMSTPAVREGGIDVLTANLTGALLVRAAGEIQGAVRSGGAIIVSGVQAHERDEVARAFSSTPIVWERTEDEWIGLVMKKP